MFLPLVQYVAKLFGASQEIVDDDFGYTSISLGTNIITCLFLALNGVLHGEGHSYYEGIASVSSANLNMVVWDPILILI